MTRWQGDKGLNRQGAKDAKNRQRKETKKTIVSTYLRFLSFSVCSWRPWRLGGSFFFSLGQFRGYGRLRFARGAPFDAADQERLEAGTLHCRDIVSEGVLADATLAV